jgi:hypothetical protein
VGRREKEITTDSAGQKRRTLPHAGVFLRGLRLAFLMKTLVALAQRPAGLALRKNVFNLGFAASEIAIGWFS